jgi:hypothetical protein
MNVVVSDFCIVVEPHVPSYFRVTLNQDDVDVNEMLTFEIIRYENLNY